MKKTYCELFGHETENCTVDGQFITRRIGPESVFVLMICDTHEQACQALRAWINEAAGHQSK